MNDHQAIPPSQSQSDVTILATRCTSGLVKYSGSESSGVSLARLISSLKSQDRLCWVINAKSAGLDTEPFEKLEIRDQLAHLDKEIKTENSIHLIDHRHQQLLAQINHALGANAATCVGMKTSFEVFETQFAVVASWFLTPASLKLHIEEGSGFLVDQIFAAIDHVLVFEPSGAQWSLFTHPSDSRSWQEIGLPNTPVSQ